MTYSQNHEDDAVAAFWGAREPGALLDIGANDGLTFSNSRLLIESGWRAALVEADPRSLAKLIERHGSNQLVKIISAAVMPYAIPEPIVPLHLSADGLYSTTDPANVNKWAQQMTGVSIAVAAVYAAALWLALPPYLEGHPVDVLSIDVEGYSAALLGDLVQSGIFATDQPHRPRVVIAEHDGRHQEIADWLTPLGYIVLALNAENIVMVMPW